MARVTLSQAGEDVIVGGSDVTVVGTSAGNEVITVVSGNIRFDASFNQGGDTIVLPGLAANYTAYRSGSEVIFTRNDGLVTVRVPVGSAGMEIQFDGGDSRTLLFNTSSNPPVATLEGQAIGTSSTAQTQLTPFGPPPPVGYDVVNSSAAVVEGDSGNSQLVFTIELDRAVTAADGPVTLNFRTLDGSALAASDYVASAGTVTFAVGQRFATVVVQVTGDNRQELDETLQLELTGAKLRNPVELLNGVVLNDDVATQLTANADNFVGTAGDNLYSGANRNLGAGDKITDASTTDNDVLSLAIDPSLLLGLNFGGFTLTNIERFEVTNDGNGTATFDLSGTTGIQVLASLNSSRTIVFDQITRLAAIELNNVTGVNADVVANYQAAVTAGAGTQVNVIIDDATAGRVFLNTIGSAGTGIEIVNLSVRGSSTIGGIVTALETLNISGSDANGSITITDVLSDTVRTINASGVAGSLGLSFANNDVTGVTFTGAQGVNTIFSGAGKDSITTFGGADVITDEGGNDTINTGGGKDTITLLGAGDVTIDTGADNDSVAFAAGEFTLNDTVNLGAGDADNISIAQASVETSFAKVTGAEVLTVTVATTTNFSDDGKAGSLVEAAGIRTVNLDNAGTDTLDATAYVAAGLTVNLGATVGSENIKLGAGDDVVNTSSFDNTDVIQGNAGNDTINVKDGSSSINSASLFSGIETITYSSDGDGDDQVLVVDADNAPTAGGTLTINAASFTKDEQLTFDGLGATYSVNVTSGLGDDTILVDGVKADTVNSGGGADVIWSAGGDTINAGAGKDSIRIFAGNNIVSGGDDNDLISIEGVGNNKISGDAGDDRIEALTSAQLTADDIIDGGSNTAAGDRLVVRGTVDDAQLGGVSNVEILEAADGGVSKITIGAQALEGGIGQVVLADELEADTLVATAYAGNLIVDSLGGDDNIKTGVGADLVRLGGAGSITIDTGAGDDRIEVSGSELDGADKIQGGAGTDRVDLDNSAGAVTATANLSNVFVEEYRITSGGDRVAGKVDTDDNVLTFTQSVGDVVLDVTPINVNASALTDVDDSFTLVIDSTVTDDDFAFNVTGSSTETTVDKRNLTIDNNINFVGGSGVDTLRIDGGDAGSTVVFDGNGGNDRIVQTGGVLTDDGFVSISEVEVLSGDAGKIDAVLGARASIAGLTRIEGTALQDKVTLGAGFNNNLTVVLGAGDDLITGKAASGTITFEAAADDFTAADILSGGTGTLDTVSITGGGLADLTSVTQVERVVVANADTKAGQTTTINIDATAVEVNGALLTIDALALDAADSLIVNGGKLGENTRVDGGAGADTITTGAGDDIINGNGGVDTVFAGGGVDTVNGGLGNDIIRGEGGNDVINGNEGNDTLYGDVAFGDPLLGAFLTQLEAYNASGAGNDKINGGEGDDIIVGGLGKDELTGGAGVDNFVFVSADDSRIFPGGNENDFRDTITDFVSGTDKIDLRQLATAAGQTIRFNGNWDSFGEGQGAVSATAPGDAFLDVVYVRNSSGGGTLWVDVNNDAQLDGRDMQIILQNVSSLTKADVYNPSVVTGPVGYEPTQSFAQAGQAVDFGGSSFEQVGVRHFVGGFETLHIA